jgi:hypothetical protein
VLLTKLEKEGHSIARLPGKQTEADYAAAQAAMAVGFDFIHQASMCQDGMRCRPGDKGFCEQPAPLKPPHPSSATTPPGSHSPTASGLPSGAHPRVSRRRQSSGGKNCSVIRD